MRYKQNVSRAYLKLVLSLACYTVMLSSCGFRSVYSQNSPICHSLREIYVVPIESLEGVSYYSHLKNILPPGHNVRYSLHTDISYTKDYSIIQRNTDALRESIKIRVKYILRNIESQQVLTSGYFSRMSSYNINFSPYSNQNSAQEVRQTLAMISAEEVRNRIVLFFENSKK